MLGKNPMQRNNYKDMKIKHDHPMGKKKQEFPSNFAMYLRY